MNLRAAPDAREGLTFRRSLYGSKRRIAWLSSLRASAGLLDLAMAGALYQLLLLLQGQPTGFKWAWMPHDILPVAVITALIVPLRIGMEFMSLHAVLTYIGEVNERFTVALAKGYAAMRWEHFIRKNRSDLANLATNTAREAALFQSQVIELLGAGVVVSTTVAAMIYRSPQAAAAIAGMTLAGYAVNRFLIRHRLRSAGAGKERASRELQRAVSDVFVAAKEMRTHADHSAFLSRIEKHIRSLALETRRVMLLPQVTKSFADQGIILVFLCVVIDVVIHGGNIHQMLALLMFYLILSRRLIPLISQVGFILSQIEGSYASACLVYDELNECELNRAVLIAASLPAEGIVLAIDDVSLAYSGVPVLRSIALQQRRGEVLLIRGPSGGGKTSLLNVIAGVLSPSSGTVSIDRSKTAYVAQETVLLDDTIRNNLLLGTTHKCDEALYDALSAVMCLELILSLSDGLDARVGDNGLRFSGGERQRLGLARAIVHDAEFLLLDEATSALDEDTEAQIFANLRQLGFAIIAVTHRCHDGVTGDREFCLVDGRLLQTERLSMNAEEAALTLSAAGASRD